MAALLYSASEVSAKVADGIEVRISEDTDYPFKGVINFTVWTEQSVEFPLYLRIPSWCKKAYLSINGSINGQLQETKLEPGCYAAIHRTWRNADQIRLVLPMEIEIETWEKIGRAVSVKRGPLWYSAEIFSEVLIQLRELYAFDGILISLHGHSSDWERTIQRIKKEENEVIVHWKNGDKTEFPRDDLPRHHPMRTATTPSLAELDPVLIGEEIEYIPVSQGLDFPINSEHKFDIFRIIHEEAGSEFSIHGEVTSPFDYFLNLFGFKKALMHLLQDPSKCKEILQRFADGVKKLAVEMTDQKIDAIKISSPYAGQGFISPEFYREFVLPFESQIARAVRERNIHVYTHTCGSIGDRLEIMVESGISGLECLDPPPLGNVELAEAKKRVGHEVFIKGNIDPVNTLLYGNKQAVRDDAENRLHVGKPNGGYILSTACSIAPHTKRENIEILAQIAEEKGHY